MIIPPQFVEAAKAKAEKRMLSQYVPALGRSIRPDEVVDLLAESTSPAAQRGARLLLRSMPYSPWAIVTGVHSNNGDGTPHITIEVQGIRYHLRLDARGCIFDITFKANDEVQSAAGVRPWVRPGSF